MIKAKVNLSTSGLDEMIKSLKELESIKSVTVPISKEIWDNMTEEEKSAVKHEVAQSLIKKTFKDFVK